MNKTEVQQWFNALLRQHPAENSNSQAPQVAMLSCSDSRVVPEYIFDAKLGQFFVVRVAGNVAGTNEIASLEFAVQNLGTQLVIIMGHSDCGAVEAACNCVGGHPPKLTPNLYHIMAEIAPALENADCTDLKSCIIKNVKNVTKNLMQKGNWKPTTTFLPCYYDMETGDLEPISMDQPKEEE